MTSGCSKSLTQYPKIRKSIDFLRINNILSLRPFKKSLFYFSWRFYNGNLQKCAYYAMSVRWSTYPHITMRELLKSYSWNSTLVSSNKMYTPIPILVKVWLFIRKITLVFVWLLNVTCYISWRGNMFQISAIVKPEAIYIYIYIYMLV